MSKQKKMTKAECVAAVSIAFANAAPRIAFSIQEFCGLHQISESFYRILRRQGRGPVETRLGRRVMISVQSIKDWQSATGLGQTLSTSAFGEPRPIRSKQPKTPGITKKRASWQERQLRIQERAKALGQ